MAQRFPVETVFKAVDKMTAPVTRMQNKVGKFSRSIETNLLSLDRTFNKFSKGIKKSLFVGTAAFATFSAAMSKVVNTGAKFEQTLVAASARFPEGIDRGTKAFQKLEDAARSTGATTEFMASQAAGALNFLAKAGLSAQASIAGLPEIVDLATASEIDLARAADISSDTLGAFGLSTKDPIKLAENFGRVNNALAKAANMANVTIDELFETIRLAGPSAKDAGVPIEQFLSLTAALAQAGTKGGISGTVFRNLFKGLTAGSSQVKDIFEDLEIETSINGDLRDTFDLLEELEKALNKLGSAERLEVLSKLFGQRGATGVSILLTKDEDAPINSMAVDRIRRTNDEIIRDVDALSRISGKMRDTLLFRLKSLSSAIESVQISIFSLSNVALTDVVEKMTAWVRVNEDLIASNIGNFLAKILNNFENIVRWMKKIGISLVVFYAFHAALKTFIMLMTAVNLVMAANPIGLIIIGVIALTAAIGAAIIWVDDWKQAFLSASPVIRAALNGIALALGAALGPIGFIISSAAVIVSNWTAVKDLFISIWDVVKKVASALGFNFNSNNQLVSSQTMSGISMSPQGLTFPDIGNPQIVSPQERFIRELHERRAEVTIIDETNRAQVTKGELGHGIILEKSASF